MNVLIELDEFDKKHITELSEKCKVTNRITLENYITTEALLELIEEVYYKIESLEEDKEDLENQLNYPEMYDDRADRLYEERRMEN
jgi:hypothetical protein